MPEKRSPSWMRLRSLAASCLRGLLLFGCAAPVAGQDGTWRFELPTLDGARFVRSAQLTAPTLLNVWGRDCAPCVAELPLLQAFAARQPGWNVLLIATDAPADAQRFLTQQRIALPTLRAGADARALLRVAGNPRGALPFTAVMHGDRICRTHTGMLDEAALAALADACSLPRSPGTGPQ